MPFTGTFHFDLGPCTGDASTAPDLGADTDETPPATFERLKKALKNPAAHFSKRTAPAVHARHNHINKESNSNMQDVVGAGGLACGESEDSVAPPNHELVSSDVDSCRERCNMVADCRSFSYSANGKMCYLKRSCGAPQLCEGKEDWHTYYFPCLASIKQTSASRAQVDLNVSRAPANRTRVRVLHALNGSAERDRQYVRPQGWTHPG